MNHTDFHPLPPQALYQQWISITIILIILFIPSAWMLDWRWVLPIFLLLSAYLFYISHLRHKRTQWRLDTQVLSFHIGLFFRHEYSIARSRVQYVDVTQGPLQRLFNTSQLIIHTAGSMNVVRITGLHHHDAQAIRDELIEVK